MAVLFGLAVCRDAGLTLIRPAVAAGAATEHGAGATASAASTGEAGHGGHSDPVAPVLAAVVLMLLLAKIGGDLFERMGLPAVLGELVLGVLLGNVSYLTGAGLFDFMQPPVPGEAVEGLSVGAALQLLAGIGVVLLLFEVGLESTVREMLSVGASSLTVALLGVAAPAVLGYVVCRGFFFESWQEPVFIGATLCATSVGITARVLKDLGRSKDRESRIILGAAVIDDVLGLIVLAVASGVILAADRAGGAGGLPWGEMVSTVAWAFGFLGVAVLLGMLHVPRFVFKAMSLLHGHGLLVASALMICFGMAYLANLIGLQPIVGAFAAGLILENAHYHDLERRENVELEEVMHPLTALLVPVFFVQTGMSVKLEAMADPSTWVLAVTLTVIAVVGKQACALGVFGKGLNRTAVGLGMIPRGEVGLIFADQGRKLITSGGPVVDDSTFSAIVFMVMATTLVTPPLLKWSMGGALPDGRG
jgi:Kef-type K+ transport system membrane component KefB